MKNDQIYFVEQLLECYKSMHSERFNLNKKWDILERQKKEAVDGEFLSAMIYSDIPGIPKDGMKPSRLLISNSKEEKQIQDEQTFISVRLLDLDDILSCIDNSLNSLKPMDKQILIYYYVDKLSLNQIADVTYIYPDNVCRHKTKALEYAYESLKALEGTVIFKTA